MIKQSDLIVGVTQIKNNQENKIETVCAYHLVGLEEFPESFVKNYEHIPIDQDIIEKSGFMFKRMSGIGGAVDYRHTGHWYYNDEPIFRGCKGPLSLNKTHFDIYYFMSSGVEVELKYWYEIQMIVYSLTKNIIKL